MAWPAGWSTAQRVWLILAIVALIFGAAFGYFALRPLPRSEFADVDPGYLMVDSTAAAAESLASPPPRSDGPAAPPQPAGSVVLDTPRPNQYVESPMWVVGRARGSWFFEAEFPVRLLDQRDSVVTFGIARAGGEWMTADFVPFALTLNFTPPSTDVGTLVLERSNPSGLPEHAASVRVPVRFR